MENLKKFIDEVKGEQERTNEELIEELEDIILGIQRFLYIENDEFKDISDIVESDFLIDTWIYEYAEKVLQLIFRLFNWNG